MNDLIYKQDAIDTINALHEKPNAWLDSAVDAVMILPSAERKGRWVETTVRGSTALCCSYCGQESGVLYRYNYCPNCGAKMEVVG